MNITNWFWWKQVTPKVPLTSVSNKVVEQAVRKVCKEYFMTDAAYIAPKKEDIEKLFNNNIGRFLKYRAEEYDCDDFARTASATLHLLFGNIAIGECAVLLKGGGAHMINIVVTPDGEVVYVEPQNNTIYKTVDFKPYFVII